jgi:hypothetical protein
MSTLTKQAKQHPLSLVALVALGCVVSLLVFKMPPLSQSERSSTPVTSLPSSHWDPPQIARSSAPSQPVFERPLRLMPAGDPTTPTAQRLRRFLVEAQLTDAQQQLFFGLLWDAKMQAGITWDHLIATWDFEMLGDFYEQADADIDAQMRAALTPSQWEVYERVIRDPTSLFHEFPISHEPGVER